jgi:hypothetical protein
MNRGVDSIGSRLKIFGRIKKAFGKTSGAKFRSVHGIAAPGGEAYVRVEGRVGVSR